VKTGGAGPLRCCDPLGPALCGAEGSGRLFRRRDDDSRRGEVRWDRRSIHSWPGGGVPAPEDLKLLGTRFGFHPLTLEDCEHLDQRPKLELFDGYVFMVLHGFAPATDLTVVDLQELHVFFSHQYLITVHQQEMPVLEALWRRIRTESSLSAGGIDLLLHRLCDEIVDANFPIITNISDVMDAIEATIFERTDPQALEQLLKLKRSLSTMRRVLSPQRDVFNQLLRDTTLISERARPYFRDVYDHLTRVYEEIDALRDLLANARDAHFSVLSQRTNEIMKRLTLLSLIFLPLTFLTGFFGMNFTHMPFDNDGLLITMVLSMLLLPAGMLWWFRRMRWFS